ncbi:hypothetical protein HanRHA438_Chr15g0689271 [Helianthus annuus]|nr:hypothetical protein HanRHA438_Chr15g0689271 [Helianthus annuus]
MFLVFLLIKWFDSSMNKICTYQSPGETLMACTSQISLPYKDKSSLSPRVASTALP